MEKVKIVIWDMDETFWKGTLSEGGVEKIEQNVTIVQELVNRGIMCSICSKNNFEDVKSVLSEWGIWDLFIFPQITWGPKGEQVKSLLEQCSLRSVNALFIDDNISNLHEVEFYNQGIMTALPNILEKSFLDIPEIKGKDDRKHSRLKQYKVLEERQEKGKSFSSNEDFLRASHIKIFVDKNCHKSIERISELIQRTNQLNYTKIRITDSAVAELLEDNDVECSTISVVDDFGEYGITGFYALKNNRLLHFVFSCRIIGFGIENYLYKKLGYPDIDIVGDVSTELSRDYAERIDWIEEIDNESQKDLSKSTYRERILMVGGCDLDQTCAYLDSKVAIDKEFNTIIDGYEIRTSDLSQLVNSYTLTKEEQKELCDNIPFFHEDITFKTKLFSQKYDIVIISVIDDYIRGMWKNKEHSYFIGYGGFFDQEQMLARFSEKELIYLRSHFDYVGKEDITVFTGYLREIIAKIGRNTNILLINGVDLDVSAWIGEERVMRNREMNEVVDSIVEDYENVELIDIRRIVVDESQLPKKDNRHLDRNSYYKIAEEILAYCQAYYGNYDGKLQSINRVRFEDFIKKVKNKLNNLF